MPRTKQSQTKIEVSEATTADTRTITLIITAPAQEFLLADLLRQRSALSSVGTPLKQAVIKTLNDYLKSADNLIAGAVKEKKKVTAES